MERKLGNIFGFQGGNYAGNVYDKDFECPTLNTMQGGCKQPMVIDDTQGFEDKPRLYINNAPCLRSERSGLKTIVAMRGRNPTNPSDRTQGIETEQRLEPNTHGTCNTLTSVQKDNLVMEKVKIKQATKQGYIECELGGVADLSYPNSKTRRGRVQENGQVSPTLTAGEQDICRIEKEVINPLKYLSENGWHFEQNVYDSGGLVRSIKSESGSGNIPKVIEQYRIRKLTPKECWRLMDFSDEDFEKAADVNSNTQLYKQAGNSIVKNALVAILGQMIPGKENVYKELSE